MKNKLLPVVIIFIIISALVFGIILSNQKTADPDTVKLNELRAEVEKNTLDYAGIDSFGLDIIVIDKSGAVKFSYTDFGAKSYDEWINYAYKNNCLIIDFSDGKIFVAQPPNNTVSAVVWITSLYAAVLAVLLIFYNLYIQKTMFEPFKKLKGFAGDVAVGDFDKPLPMDKNNLFGAFSESFDLMRAELKKSKEKEIELEKSKKQLVAELSHDIKTPLASIKAVSEILKLGETEDKKLKNLDIIQRKATEIDNLVSDLFNSTLQDLSELKINIDTVSSKEISRIITEADYLNKITAVNIPGCLVRADSLRLMQVVGNIINNSYKYADTKIFVSAELTEKALGIEFADCGQGVPDEELPLITNRFYRGKNSEKTSGAGLGLFICKLILERMGGGIDCYNTDGGFAVKIILSLA